MNEDLGKRVERVLIVQLADIGDLILSMPALAALREAQPSLHITVLTSAHAAPVIPAEALVDRIITLDRHSVNSSTALLRPANVRQLLALRREHFDALVFFHHFTLHAGTLKFAFISAMTGARVRLGLDNGNGWFLTHRVSDRGFGERHQAQYWLDLVSRLGTNPAPRPAVIRVGSPPELPSSSGPRVVIHAGSGGYSLARRWDTDRFARVARALRQERRAQIVLVGGPADDAAVLRDALGSDAIDLSGRTTLPELAGLLRTANLFIGADSGVMHLAAAVGAPTLAIFGPSNPDAWGPWAPGGQTAVVRSAPECSPCSYVGHAIGLREGCPARTCMRLITEESVLDAARRLLDGSPRAASRQPAKDNSLPVIRILGLPVAVITYSEWLDRIEDWVKGDRPHHVCTINPEFIMIARKDANFRNILSRADLCVPDGVGLLWAARRLGHPLPERVTGSDGVPIIAARAAERGWRLFLLGAGPGVVERAAHILRQRHPALQIAGLHAGSPSPEEEAAIVERVNQSRADILFVAYGAPEQDKWIARNLPRLRVKMAMGVGGALDFIAGSVPRAPEWMRRLGLEWLFRLIRQPWRIRRMTRLPRFVLAVLLRGADG